MTNTCQACGKAVVLINLDMARGVVGLTRGWVHTSRWARHAPIVEED